MKPNKSQFRPLGNRHRKGNAEPTVELAKDLVEANKPASSLIGNEVDRRAKKLVDSQRANQTKVSRVKASTDAQKLFSIQGKLLEPLGRDVRQSSDKEATKLGVENVREYKTAAAVKDNRTIASLTEDAKKGRYLEVSGDALARAKRGDAPKIITTTNTWEKRKKDLGVGD